MQIYITDQEIAGNPLIFSLFTNSVFKISQGNHISLLDICLFKLDKENTLEQCVKSAHLTNQNDINDFSDTNKKFLSNINKTHSTAADLDKYLLSLKSSKVWEPDTQL